MVLGAGAQVVENVALRGKCGGLGPPRDEALRAFIVATREAAGLRQVDVAERLGRYQSYVSHVESRQKVIDVVELMAWAEAFGFTPSWRSGTSPPSRTEGAA